MKKFIDQVKLMNKVYNCDCPDKPTLHKDTVTRLTNFETIIRDEIQEVNDIIYLALNRTDGLPDIAVLTLIADWLGDIIVYATSEMIKYGIPPEEVLSIIMDSNMSKLGADGEPIISEIGKIIKGPNYWKPEPEINAFLTQISEGE